MLIPINYFRHTWRLYGRFPGWLATIREPGRTYVLPILGGWDVKHPNAYPLPGAFIYRR